MPNPLANSLNALPKPVRVTFRWVARLIAVAAVLLVLGYIALHLTVRAVIKSVLAGQNLAPVSYELHKVTPFTLVVGNVRVGPDGPRLGLVSAKYSPLALLRGHIQSVTVAGAEATININPADLSPSGISVPGLPPFGATTQPASKPFDPNVLPDDLQLLAAVVHVRSGNREFAIPLSAQLTRTPDNARKITGSIELGPDKLTLTGTGRTPSDLLAEVKGKLSATTLLPLLPPDALPPGLTIDAVADISGTADLAAQKYRGSLIIDGANARFAQAELSQLSLEATFTKDPFTTAATAKVLTDARYLPWVEDPIKVSANLQWNGQQLTGTASALGTGATSPLAANLTAFTANTSTADASLTLEATAAPTPEITRRLQLAGLTLTNPKSVILKATAQRTAGTLTARITDLSAAADKLTAITGSQVVSLIFPSLQIPLIEAIYDGSRLTLNATSPTLRAASLDPGASVKVTRSEGFTLAGETLTAAIDSAGRVTATAPRLNLTLASTDLATPAASASNLSALIGVSGKYSPEETILRLTDGSALTWEKLTGANSSWTVGKGQADLLARRLATTRAVASTNPAGGASTQTMRVTTAPSTGPAELLPFLVIRPGQDPTASIRLEINQPISATSAGNTLNVGSARVSATVGFGETLTLSGYAALNDSDVVAANLGGEGGVVLNGLTVSWPISLDATVPLEGTFSIKNVVARNATLPGLSGTMWLTRRQAQGAFDWPLVPNGVVKASGAVYFLPGRTVADVRAWIPEFDFTDAADLRKLLPQGIADAAITGRFSADLRYSIADNNITRWGEIEIKDASVKSTLSDAEASGISGRIWTREFAPLETPPNQTLSVKSARQGKLNVENGALNFRVDPGNIIFAESASFNFAGGTLSARGFRIDPANAAADLYIYGDRLDLNQIAQLASDGKVSGTGKLYARLPVSIRYADNWIKLGEGYLYAEPPRGAGASGTLGTLQLGPYADQVTTLAIGQLPANDISAQLKTRLQATLANFNYGALSFELTRPNDQLKVQVHTEGRGPKEVGSQPLDLTLNLTGLEDALALWLGIRSKF